LITAEKKKYSGYEAMVDFEKLPGYLEIRKWKVGDRIYPLGFEGSKKVSDVLNEMKIPATEKPDYPVLAHKDEIIWIPGYRIADKYKVHENTLEGFYIKWNR
jgi:tRNA(Ile)-lysidine synthase